MRRALPVMLLLGLGLMGCSPDEDGDGVKANKDCDDADASAYPHAIEVCDGVDNNCDGVVDEATATDAATWYADGDADGYGDPETSVVACDQASGYVDNADDCDDAEPLAWTGNTEVCDGADNDCDGSTDPVTSADATTWYRDNDSDGDGDPAVSEVACDAPAGYVASGGDCDDGDDTTYSGAPEICDDGYDNQCETDDRWDCDDSDCLGDGACQPTLDAIAPSSTGLDRTVDVTLTGSGFGWLTAGTTTVSFDTVGACTGLSVVDEATVRCTAPASASEAVVDVTLTNANGSSTLTAGFSYQDLVYAADGKSATAGNLYQVSTRDGTVTTVGPLVDGSGTAYSFTGLAFDPDGTLYGVTSTSFSGASQLCTIDPATALVTVIGSISRGDGTTEYALPDVTFVGSRLIGWSESGDDPVEIDTDSAVSTVLGGGVSSAGSGMASDGAGTVYLVPRGSTMYSVDTSTGAVTATGAAVSGTSNSTINAMTFHAGTLYAVDAERSASGSSILVSIDVSTGFATAVATLPTGIDAIASPSP